MKLINKTYDNRGNITSESYRDKKDILTYSYEYDDNNNRIKTTYPLGNVFRYEYNISNELHTVITPDGYRYNLDKN